MGVSVCGGGLVNESARFGSVYDEFTRVKLWKQTCEDFPKNPFQPTPRVESRAKIKLNYEYLMCDVFSSLPNDVNVCSIIITLSHLNIKIEVETFMSK